MFFFEKIKAQDINKDYLFLLSQLTSVDYQTLNKENIENFIKNLNNNHIIFLMKDSNKNNKIIGSITILIENKIIHGFSKVGHIEDVVVDENYRGQKLGKKLINYAVELCKNNGCYKVILDCSNENVKFYEKCNFQLKGNEMSLYF
tara:strand:+ start:156 stop:593 length:438 start_codon:yes stop_codon:yes gene_type:complete